MYLVTKCYHLYTETIIVQLYIVSSIMRVFRKKSNYQILIQYIQRDYSFIEVFFNFIFYAFFKSRQFMNVFKCIYLSSHLHTVCFSHMSYEKKMKQKYRPCSYMFLVIDFSIFIIKYLHVPAKATTNKS